MSRDPPPKFTLIVKKVGLEGRIVDGETVELMKASAEGET